jgi:hypothetical protein
MGEKGFKAFRVYTPERFVTGKTARDYTAFELFRFREEFARIAEKYEQGTRVYRMAAGVFLFGNALCFAAVAGGSTTPLPLLFLVPGLLMIPVAVLRARGVKLCCPACTRNLVANDFGEFCPGCGGGIKFSRLLGMPECLECGLKPRYRKGRRFKIRACTYCGVKLHEEGV